MKIELWIVEVRISLSDIDDTFSWESDYIPNVGDSITYEIVGKGQYLPVDGVVVERTFYAGEDLVSLDVSISEKDAERISNYLDVTLGEVDE